MKKKTFKKLLILLLFIAVVVASFAAYYYIKTNNMIKDAKGFLNEHQTISEIGTTAKDISYNKKTSYVIYYPKLNNATIDKNIKSKINELKDNCKKENIDNTYQYITYDTYLAPENNMSIIFYEKIIKNKEEQDEKVYTYNINLDTGEVLNDTYFFTDGYKEVLEAFLETSLTNDESINQDYKDKINDYKYVLTNNGIKILFNQGEIKAKDKGIIAIDMPYETITDYIDIDTTLATSEPKVNAGKDKEKQEYTDVNKNYYVKREINVYKEDNKNSEKIGTLYKGDIIEVIQNSNKSWSKIKYNDVECFVKTNNLSETPVAKKGFTDTNETVYVITKSDVYDNVDGTSIGNLNYKDTITRIGASTTWSEILYNDGVAYMKNAILSTTEPTYDPANISVDPNRNIDPNKKMVALTFDDGPNPISTPRILDTLEKYNSVATFFDLGYLMVNNPSIVQREEKIGCEVGSHTYSHRDLTSLSVSELNEEINNAVAVFNSVLGHSFRIIRPPYGSVNDTVKQNVSYPFVNWDVDTLDWKSRNKNSILAQINKYSNLDGKIILMHSIYGTTADAVEELVPSLISQGYQLVTIPELAKYKGYTLENGTVYYDFY